MPTQPAAFGSSVTDLLELALPLGGPALEPTGTGSLTPV